METAFEAIRPMGMTFDFNGLDTAVNGPIRLGVLVALQMDGKQDFTSLKKRLYATDGALGMHLQKLEEADYIHSTKAFVNKRPKTTYRITTKGRQALNEYLRTMQKLAEAIGIDRV